AAVPVLQPPRQMWRLPGPPKLRYALAVPAEQQGDSGVPAVLGLRLSMVDRHASPHAPAGRLSRWGCTTDVRARKRYTELDALEAGLQLHRLPRPSAPDNA